MTRRIHAAFIVFLSLTTAFARAQQPLPPTPQPTHTAILSGYTADSDDDAIPNAAVTVDSATEHFTTTSDAIGFFEIIGVHPGTPYRVTVTAPGFSPKTVSNITLTPGQLLEIPPVMLQASANITVDAVTADQAALAAVHQEESQRVLGLIPNFYVVYGNAPFVALPTRLKFHLALKAATDPATFVATGVISGIDQAAFTPSYVEGAKGFGQRLGANYADTATNIFLGGAIFPSMFHQDPRYFVQGTGTKKSRFLHAASAPFITFGDNGHRQFNISSISGDITSASISNIYYPPADRGAGLLFTNVGITTGGRILNAIFQEFLFGRVTSHSKSQ